MAGIAQHETMKLAAEQLDKRRGGEPGGPAANDAPDTQRRQMP